MSGQKNLVIHADCELRVPTGDDCLRIARGGDSHRWILEGFAGRFNKLLLELMLAGFCCMFMIGCSDSSLVVKPMDGNQPAVNNRDDIWSNLAKCMTSKNKLNKPLISNTTQLQKVLEHLRDLGTINDSDVQSAYRLFPEIESKEIQLSEDDAAKLLTLPVKMVGGK